MMRRSPQLFLIFPFLCILAVPVPVPVSAETKVLTAEATYTMGDGETPSFAEAMALQKAKQMALEQAGTYVESYTKVQNYQLTADEIQTIAGGVLKVEVLEKKRELIGDGMRHYVKINATVTTDKIADLAQRIKGKNVVEEYKKLQEEYARLGKEIEKWKQLIAKTPTGPERKAALDQIKERERRFAAAQKNEVSLFERLVSGQDLVSASAGEQVRVDQIIQSIAQKGHVITLDEPKAKAVAGKTDYLQLVISIKLKVAASLIPKISETAKSLGGAIWPEFKVNLRVCDRRKVDEARSSRPTLDELDALAACTEEGIGAYWLKGSSVRIRTGMTNSPKVILTLIRFAEDPYIAQYFQEMIYGLRFALQLTAAKGEDAFCILGSIPALEKKKDPEKKPSGNERLRILEKNYKEWEPLRRIFPIGEIKREPVGSFEIHTKFHP